MENILDSSTQFYSVLVFALFVFAIFVILVFFILGRDRKKPLKVHHRPAVNQCSDTLHDILAFFDRKCLSRLRSVNSRFNQTIQREFAKAPYLVLEEYTDKKSVRDRNRRIVDEVMVNEILAEKFVRFKHANVKCDDYAQVMHLLSKSEPWQTFDLKLTAEFKLTKYNARQLAKCEKVKSISFRGRLTFLPEFLLGKCLKLYITDDLYKTADSASVPWTKILDFLFCPGGTYVLCRYVDIATNEPPSDTEYFRFINAMKQRFANATAGLHFQFFWRATGVQVFHNEERLDNVKQRLIFNPTNYYGKHNGKQNPSIMHIFTV